MSCLPRAKVEARLGSESTNLKVWQDLDYFGDMSYMNRSDALLCSPAKLLDNYKSILTFLVPYSNHVIENGTCPVGYGKVARYAQGLDYHIVLKKKLNDFVSNLNLDRQVQFKIFSDSVPTLERSIASEGGLGFIGKSSMLISPDLGTYTFICELIWDLEVRDVSESPKIKSHCGTCIQCKVDCPTNAIVSDYRVDARKCISYLTIEKREEFTPQEASFLGDWVFGCDVCQEVCPHNINKKNTALIPTELLPSAGVGPVLDLREIMQIKSELEFKDRFKGSPILRTKRVGLVRNALAVALNQNACDLLPQIESIANFDQEPRLKSFASSVVKSLVR